MSEANPQCVPECWEMPDCPICKRLKPPRGRDVPVAASGTFCEHECPGYAQEPQPGHHWPNEECDDYCK